MNGWNAWTTQALRYAPISGGFRLQAVERDLTALPISFAEACDHLRLGDPAGAEAAIQQNYIEGLIRGATLASERYVDMALSPQQWRLYAAGIAGGSFAYDPLTMPGGLYASRQVFVLPKPPLKSVDSITVDGRLVDPATYGVVPDDVLGGIVFGKPVFPTGQGYPDSVVITFTAGYDDPTLIPEDIRRAMLLMIGTWFMNRESAMGYSLSVLPDVGALALLDAYRSPVFA